MKEIVRLTESDLHKVVQEAVNTILNEISRDTIYSAMKKSQKKAQRADYNTPGTPESRAARDQYDNFSKEYLKRYNSGNDRSKARNNMNARDIDSGKRTYIKGTGWRTKDN